MQTADFYSSATGTLRVNGGRDENAPQGVSLSIDDLSYIKQGSRATDSGGTGTADYNELSNKPKINSVTLESNKTAAQLGLATTSDISNIKQVPTVTSSDNNKVLTASYSGGTASYAWAPASSGGTSDYTELSNKPQINSITLTGNVSLSDIGVQPAIDSSHKVSADNIDDTDTTNKFATAAQLQQIETNKNNILKAEQLTINTGVVNLSKFSTGDTSATKWITGSGNTDVTCDIKAGNYVLIANFDYDSGGNNIAQMLVKNADNTEATLPGFATSSNTIVNFTLAKDIKSFGVYVNQLGVTVTNFAIIPKTVYDIGYTSYTPYTPTNYELYQMILALQ